MQTTQALSQTETLGDVIAATYEVSDAVAPDQAIASELAARHLERVLVRGANLRVVAVMRQLAAELGPPRVRPVRPNVRDAAWAPARLTVAR